MVFFPVYPQARPRQNTPPSHSPAHPRNERPMFSSTCKLAFQQLVSFDSHTNAPGVWGSKSEEQAKAKKLTPLESALTKNTPITPLESADPKTLDLKSFRIRTYEKRRGEGGKLLTGILLARMAPIRVQQLAVPRAHPSSRKHPQEASSCCHLRERSSLGGGSFSSHVSARSQGALATEE